MKKAGAEKRVNTRKAADALEKRVVRPVPKNFTVAIAAGFSDALLPLLHC
jgi:hypothetical protein